MLTALARREQGTLVAEVMRREFQVVDSFEMLETPLARLQACECHTLPVTHNGQLLGLVTMDNVGELIMILQAALGAKRS